MTQLPGETGGATRPSARSAHYLRWFDSGRSAARRERVGELCSSAAASCRLVAAAGGVAGAWITRLIGPDLKAFRRLHRLTVAYAHPVPAPVSSAAGNVSRGRVADAAPNLMLDEPDELAAIEEAARGCGVFHRRARTPPAIEVCLDGHVWAITPDPVGKGWLACSRELELCREAATPLWLRRAPGETTVPTIAWGRLLAGEPRDRTWPEGSSTA